jgi:hypothetical protein
MIIAVIIKIFVAPFLLALTTSLEMGEYIHLEN